jgi:hypothetical protein
MLVLRISNFLNQDGPNRGGLRLSILITDFVVAEILDHRVQFDFEPCLEHREVSTFGPGRLIGVPPIEFILKYRGMHCLENLPRLLVVAVA